MSWGELAGLLISIGAFLFLMFRGVFKESQKQQEEEKAPVPSKKPPLVPKREPLPKQKLKREATVSRHFEEKVTYDVIGKAQASKAHRILGSLKSKKEMVILKEIIERRPKGL